MSGSERASCYGAAHASDGSSPACIPACQVTVAAPTVGSGAPRSISGHVGALASHLLAEECEALIAGRPPVESLALPQLRGAPRVAELA